MIYALVRESTSKYMNGAEVQKHTSHEYCNYTIPIVLTVTYGMHLNIYFNYFLYILIEGTKSRDEFFKKSPSLTTLSIYCVLTVFII